MGRKSRIKRERREAGGQPTSLVGLLQNYDPLSLFTALSAAAVFPENSVVLPHFDYLQAIILTLRPPYGMAHVDHDALAAILHAIPNSVLSSLGVIEDFVPADNLDNVRLFHNGKPHRVFYGELERPIAEYERFVTDFMLFDDTFLWELGYESSTVFEWTIGYHDYLLSCLEAWDSAHPMERATRPGGEPVCPPDEFVDYWRSILPTSGDHLLQFIAPPYREEVQRWISDESIAIGSGAQPSLSGDYPLTRSSFVRLGQYTLAPLPQFSIDRLDAVFGRALTKHRVELNPRLLNQTVEACYDVCRRLFFGGVPHRVLRQVEIGAGADHAHFPLAVLFDTTTLFLIGIAAEVSSEADLQHHIDDMVGALDRARSLLSNSPAPIIHHLEGDVGLANSTALDPIGLIIINQFGLSPKGIQLPHTRDMVLEAFAFSDFLALAWSAGDGMVFLKYLRAWQELQISARVFATDRLDPYAYYISNGSSFPRGVALPNLMSFESHGWSEYEHQKLRTDVRQRALMAEEGIPLLAKSRTRGDSVLVADTFDPLTRRGVKLVSSEDGQRVVIHVSDPWITLDELHLNNYLAMVISYHLERTGSVLWEQLGRIGWSKRRIRVIPCSEEQVRKENPAPPWLEALDQRPNVPYVAVALPVERPDTSDVALVYRPTIADESQLPANVTERGIWRELVFSLVQQANEGQDDVELAEVADAVVLKIVPPGPRLINLHRLSISQATEGLRRPLEESAADDALVEAAVARHLKDRGVQPGQCSQEQAKTIINGLVYPFLEKRLLEELAKYDIVKLTLWTYNELEQVEADRHVGRTVLALDYATLPLEYDAAERMASREEEAARRSSELRLMLEHVVSSAPRGQNNLSREHWVFLRSLCTAMFRMVNISEALYYGFPPLSVRVDESWRLLTDRADEDGVLDLDELRYQQGTETLSGTRNPGVPRADQTTVDGSPSQSRTGSVFNINPALSSIDPFFRQQFGYGLDDLFGVFVGLSSYPIVAGTPDAPLATATPTILVQEICESVEGLDQAVVSQVIRDLSLTHPNMAAEAIEPWRLRERRNRLSVRPIIEVTDHAETKLIWGTWTSRTAGEIWLRYLDAADVPLPLDAIQSELAQALEEMREAKNRALEDDLIGLLESVFGSEHVLRNVPSNKFKYLFGRGKGESDPGEIDALAADQRNKVLWVLDAKDVSFVVTPRAMISQYRHFFLGGKDGYAEKLRKKTEYVSSVLDGALARLGIREVSEWQVKGAFVTRELAPAAFSRITPFPILRLTGLLENLLKIGGPP